ncbi:MAG: amino acid racemase [Alphaproteobacteria bacterium]|nr:amino acid racemase [Alphaproteobacteria bacterium]
MKHIGILAHSAEGAGLCFLTAVHEGEARLGPHDHPEITLCIAPLARSMAHWEKNDAPAVRAILAETAQRLAAAGADFFACPDNTAHIALECEGPPLALPGLHIAEVAAGNAPARGFDRVGLLGTRWTMEGPAYAGAFARAGLTYRVPPPGEREEMHSIIFDELVRGIFATQSRGRVVAMIEGLRRRGCDAVALSCTEIPLLVNEEESPLPVIDSTRLLAKEAVAVALGERPMPTWRGNALKYPPT